MKVIFCADPLAPRQPDTLYSDEADAVRELVGEYWLINFEALIYENNAQTAVRRIPAQEQLQEAVYRGWMLKPEHYQKLYTALLGHGIRLINSPEQYIYCHYFPESYASIEGQTPKSVWLPYRAPLAMDEVMTLVESFGDVPIIVKDYVKSQKHYWEEACFIPSATDRASVERVVQRFVELQGDDLNEGLVFREFIEYQPLTVHSQSGMPLTKEYRIFFLDGDPVYSFEYWDEGSYEEMAAPVEQFIKTAQGINSRFFTMDIAQRLSGEWQIVELGDGQVAGLPEHSDPVEFYQQLAKQLTA